MDKKNIDWSNLGFGYVHAPKSYSRKYAKESA